MLTGLSDRKEKKQYGLTAHQPGLDMSDLMFRVVLSNTWSLGLDCMLSIDRNITIGPQYRTSVCSFTIERSLDVIFTDLRKPFLVFALVITKYPVYIFLYTLYHCIIFYVLVNA